MKQKTKKYKIFISIFGQKYAFWMGIVLVLLIGFLYPFEPVRAFYFLPKLCGAGIFPPNPNCVCGDYIAGDFTFTQDMNCSDYDDDSGESFYYGFRIYERDDTTGPITIDCNGYRLYATGILGGGSVGFDGGYTHITSGCGSDSNGVCSNACNSTSCKQNVTIKNCAIEGFETGVSFNASGWRIEKNMIKGNFDGINRRDLKVGIWAQASSGTLDNTKILTNDILEATNKGMVFYKFFSGNEISGNRVTAYAIQESVDTNAGIELQQPKGVVIKDNYLDCPTRAGLTECNNADLFLNALDASFSMTNIDIYNNVFSGKGVWILNGSSNDIDFSPLAGDPKKRNVFSHAGNVQPSGFGGAGCVPNDGADFCDCDCEPTLSVDPECAGIPSGYNACVTANRKDCVDPPTGPPTVTYSENTCFRKNSGLSYLTPLSITAMQLVGSGVILDCAWEAPGNNSIFYAESGVPGKPALSTGLLIKGQTRQTVAGCDFHNFLTGIQIENSEDMLLRWNYVKNNPSLKNGYFFNITSDESGTELAKDYKHEIYNSAYRPFASPGNVPIRIPFNWTGNTLLGEEHQVLYFHNKDGFTVDSTDPYFADIGHLTYASSNDITVKNITIDDGDPLTFVDIGAASNPYSIIQKNISKNNYYGFRVYNSNKIQFEENDAIDNEIYGANFRTLKNSLIGHSTDAAKGNNFDNNIHGGAFILGKYDLPPVQENNIFINNTFINNGLWGLLATDIVGNKFQKNTITGNGTKLDAPGYSNECSDGVDNDGDTFIDTSVLETDCVSPSDSFEGLSQGFYMNSAYNNLIGGAAGDGNTINNNVGDNFFLDSSLLLGLNEPCLVSLGIAKTSSFNIFLNNTFENSAKGSGVLIRHGQCNPGNIYVNSFGYFYLQNTNTPTTYEATPSQSSQSELSLFPFFKPTDFNSGILPLAGNNVMNGNFLDGIILVKKGSNDRVIERNDFYANASIQNNLGNGIYFYSDPDFDALSEKMKYNDIIGESAILSNGEDVTSDPNGGIYLYNIRGTRAFGNTLKDNKKFGIRVEKGKSNVGEYTEIGNERISASPLSLPYKNIIDKSGGAGHKIGVDLYDDAFTYVISNEIKNYSLFGIQGLSSENTRVWNNIITDGANYSVGIAIMSYKDNDSKQWSLQNNKIINKADGSNISGRYLYVGPYRVFNDANLDNFYPYPISNVGYTYFHTIHNNNLAGPSEALKKPIYYQYGETSLTPFTSLGAANASYHIQIANSKIIPIDGVPALDGADPLEINFYPQTSGVAEIKNLTFRNCRADCMVLYKISKKIEPSDTEKTDPVTISNITIESSQRSGIKGFYVDNAVFDNINITGDDTLGTGINKLTLNENGGLYLYHSDGNTIRNSDFKYKVSPADVAKRKWDIFFGGQSGSIDGSLTGKNIIKDNIFGTGVVNSGSGAYELRAEFATSTFALAPFAMRKIDYMCYANDSDTFCDPNCTNAQDVQCSVLPNANTPPGIGCSTKQGSDGGPFDCCFMTLLIIDNECNKNLQSNFPTSFCNIGDDGCCLNISSNDGVCDPNCTLSGDLNCTLQNGGNPSSPDDTLCSNTSGGVDIPFGKVECCNGLPDAKCDYDCPAGFDPDCVVRQDSNDWCVTPSNDFLKIVNGNPNYYEPNLQPPAGAGGGGVPNGSFFCNDPLVKIETITQGNTAGYRNLPLGASKYTQGTRINYKYNFKTELKFSDFRGLDLEAQMHTCGAGSGISVCNSPDGISGYYSDFYDGIIDLTTPAPAQNNGPSPVVNPGVYNSEPYALGDAFETSGQSPIQNFDVSGFGYLSTWDLGVALHTKITAHWDASRNSVFGSLSDQSTRYAQLETRNKFSKIGKTGLTGQPYFRDNVLFNYDFKKPCAGIPSTCPASGSPKINAPTVGVKITGGFTVTWAALVNPTDESSWTNGVNKAHYEIWYAATAADANARVDTNSNPSDGPFLWDDIGYNASSGLSSYYENKTAPDCSGAKTKCDALLSNIGQNTTKIITGLAAISVNLCVLDDLGNETCGYVAPAQPYVETRYGNIYSGGNIGLSTEPSSKNSATFLIQAAGTIDKWTSLQQTVDTNNLFPSGQATSYTAYPAGKILPQKSNNYTVSFASLDFLNQASVTYETDITKELKSRYGDGRFEKITASGQIDSILGGKIYYYEGNLTIGSPITFKIGSGSTLNASGLIIVNGNLTINSDIIYENLPVVQVKSIPSVAWLVLGDITVNPNLVPPGVKTISGTFFALGKVANPCTVNCGTFNSGDDSTGGYKQLKVNGLIMARTLDFQRRYTGADGASELIIYDGRLQANPPLGMEDFMRGLPKWTQ